MGNRKLKWKFTGQLFKTAWRGWDLQKKCLTRKQLTVI